jgi:peptidyl-prolyl cis-trans isomerase SurA
MLAALLLAAILGSACRHAPPSDVVARVNGRDIPRSRLERLLTERIAADPRTMLPAQTQRLELALLAELIDREAMFQAASRQGLAATAADIDREMPAIRAREPNVPETELRQDAAEQATINRLIAREAARVVVTDDEIRRFYDQNRAAFTAPEPRLHVAEIFIASGGVAGSNPGAGNKPRSVRETRQKLALVEKRLSSGQDFATVASELSEDPNTASSGGDLGLISEQDFTRQSSPAMARAVLTLSPGAVTAPIQTAKGYYILKLLGREPAGLKSLNDPETRHTIEETIRSVRTDLLQEALLAKIRDKASVDNYLAESILENGGK